MASTSRPDSIRNASLLNTEQPGDKEAIAQLLQQTLRAEGLSVTLQSDALGSQQTRPDHLHLLLNGKPTTSVVWVLDFIQQSVRQLAPPSIKTLQIDWPGEECDRPSQPSPTPGTNVPPSPILPPHRINPLPTAIAAGFQQTLAQPDRPVPHVIIGQYDTQLTESGLFITTLPLPSQSPWQKRSNVDPRYICPSITRLLNRQTAVKAAIATLKAGGAMEFEGQPGTGQTALLCALCHHPQLIPRFPGGILYQRTHDRPLEDILGDLFNAIYCPRQDGERTDSEPTSSTISETSVRKPTPSEIKHLLGQQQICAVLDQMQLSGEQLSDLDQWPRRLPLLVALSSRANSHHHQHGIPNSRHLPIKGLPLNDAVVWLEEQLERSLQAHEQKPAKHLCEQLAGHPLRLAQMATLMRSQYSTLPELVQQLRQGTMAETIMLRFVSELPEEERRIIAILAAFGHTPMHSLHIPTLANLDRVTDTLTTLVKQGILGTDGTYYTLATNLLAPLQHHWNLAPWSDQGMEYFKAWLQQLLPQVETRTGPAGPDQSGPNQSGPNQAGTWSRNVYDQHPTALLAPICENSEILWAVLRHAAQRQQWLDVLAMGNIIGPGLWLGGQWGRWQQVLVLQWQAARSLKDKATTAFLLHQVGSVALCLSDEPKHYMTAQTCLAQALQYRIELDDQHGASITQHHLSLLSGTIAQPALPSQTPAVSNQNSSDRKGAVEPPEGKSGQSPNQRSSSPDPETSSEAAVFQSTAWFPWLWIAIATGGLALIGLFLFLLLRPPETPGASVSKLRSKHTFPPQRIGVVSEPHSFTITNSSARPLDIAVAFEEGDSQEFSIDGQNCTDQPLSPNDTCVIAATFTPQQNGPRSAEFQVQLGQDTKPKPLTLQGVGAPVQADLRPGEVDFGQHIVAERSDAKTITLKNNGPVAFMVAGSTLTKNNDNAFFIERDMCSTQILQPRDSCTLDFSFTPTNSTDYRVIAEIRDDTGTEVWRIPLMGNGIRPPLPPPTPVSPPFVNPSPSQGPTPPPPPTPSAPETPPSPADEGGDDPARTVNGLNFSPSEIRFGPQAITTPSIRTLRVQNSGPNALEITGLELDDTSVFTITEETCSGPPIAAGNECVVAIAFNPTLAQSYSTRLTISDSENNAQPLAIRGTGAASDIVLPPLINLFTANPTDTLQPSDSTELCYDLTNANQAYIVNQTTGATIQLPSTSAGCVSQIPGVTTTYTLVVANPEQPPVENTVTVSVAEPEQEPPEQELPDQEPPTSPVAIAPTGSHPLYCNNTVTLEWQSATDNQGPISYEVTLQRQDVAITEENTVESVSNWTTVINQPINQTSLDISSTVTAPYVYRWQVRALDASGNASNPTVWEEFWCINP